jgi:hypothetical protein
MQEVEKDQEWNFRRNYIWQKLKKYLHHIEEPLFEDGDQANQQRRFNQIVSIWCKTKRI